MSGGGKHRPDRAPQGLFSNSKVGAEPAADESEAPTVRPEAADAFDDETTVEIPAMLMPKPGHGTPTPGEEVLEELAYNASDRASSSFPPPLGQAEGHDAWTLDRMSRQSTVPPTRNEEVDRLRELSATRASWRQGRGSGDSGDAFDLVDRSQPLQQPDLIGEMEELYALDDLSGALQFAELILGREPDNAQARACAESCRKRLVTLYSSKLGELSDVPVPALPESELRWLGLDHRAGFLLSRVDGNATFEDVLDVCGMPRLEALKTLVELLERGAIRVR